MRAVVPDLTGHGRSPPWPEPQPLDFHDDVAQVVELLTEPAHVVGHSYGGLVALHAALAAPDRVRSLALYDPVAFGALDRTADADALASLPADLSWDRGAEAWLTTFVDYWGGAGAWAALKEPVRAEFRRVGWAIAQAVASLMRDPTPASAYAAIRVPVLLLSGEHSPLAAHRVRDRLAPVLAARIATIAGAGHMGPLTHADRVEREILAGLT
jgi:pimeloyl-ACP methyl ester carboxylesterase